MQLVCRRTLPLSEKACNNKTIVIGVVNPEKSLQAMIQGAHRDGNAHKQVERLGEVARGEVGELRRQIGGTRQQNVGVKARGQTAYLEVWVCRAAV